MYSLNYSKLQGKPVYGFGSPNRNHGINNINGKSVKSKYEMHNKFNTDKDKHGVYGRSKDPFKTYRSSQHHVINTTKYYDRKEENKKVLGVEEQSGKPANSMSEMTFRRFKPKKGYLLVEDFKSYEDPIVHPHFVQNAKIYEEMRSSIGTRQRLDGSLIRKGDEQEQKVQGKEKTPVSKKEGVVEKGQSKADGNNQEAKPRLKKKKRPFSAVQRVKQSRKQESKPENPQFDEIKKQVVTILNDQEFEIKYNARKTNKRPRIAKKRQITSDGLQKIAKDVYDKIKESEKTKASEQNNNLVKQEKAPVSEAIKQQIAQKKEEQPKPVVTQEKKKQVPSENRQNLNRIFPSTKDHSKLTSTQYRRSYSPPKQRMSRVESRANELELKQKIDLEKRLGCNTSYNQMFKYSKSQLDEVKSVKPAGVGTFFAN